MFTLKIYSQSNDVKYEQDSQSPYIGEVFRLHDNGNKSLEGNFKNGLKHGKWIDYRQNGKKWIEETYKDGKKDGSRNERYENGQMSYERTWKDGKEISFKLWNKDDSVEE